jgi:hypothetical protein
MLDMNYKDTWPRQIGTAATEAGTNGAEISKRRYPASTVVAVQPPRQPQPAGETFPSHPGASPHHAVNAPPRRSM